jgi:hypothetical protein
MESLDFLVCKETNAMRLLVSLALFSVFSCSDGKPLSKQIDLTPIQKETELKTKEDTLRAIQQLKERFYPDTPKMLKSGDFVFSSVSKGDEVYFGKGFAPLKLEPRDILEIEQVLDSIMKNNRLFKGKRLQDYKYVIVAARRSNLTDATRIQAICKEAASTLQWELKRIEVKDGGDCYFSLEYIFNTNRVESLVINDSP